MRRILLFCCFIVLTCNVLAVEGVSPGSYKVDFKVGLEKDFIFIFVVDEKESLTVEGDLAEYVVLDKYDIFEKEKVVATLKFPESLDKVGVSYIRIFAGDVVGVIKVDFGYPDYYVGLDLDISNVNIGEEVFINLRAFNFGKEALNVSPIVDVFYEGEKVGYFNGTKKLVNVSSEVEYIFKFYDSNYSGDYFVVAFFDDFTYNDYFKVGEKNLNILNYTNKVYGGGVRKFEIEIESLWNDEMNKVFAEVRGVEGGGSFSNVGFDTSIVSLGGWEEGVLVGYLDATKIEGEILLNIDVYYDGKIESKVVRVIIDDGLGNLVWLSLLFVLILAVFFAWRIFNKSK